MKKTKKKEEIEMKKIEVKDGKELLLSKSGYVLEFRDGEIFLISWEGGITELMNDFRDNFVEYNLGFKNTIEMNNIKIGKTCPCEKHKGAIEIHIENQVLKIRKNENSLFIQGFDSE